MRFVNGRIDICHLTLTELSKVKGVGRWTSEMILMFTLGRPDLLPCSDLGVQKGMLKLFLSDQPTVNIKKQRADVVDTPQVQIKKRELPTSRETLQHRLNGNKVKGNIYPTPQEMELLARDWEPYRSVASMTMWALVDT